MRLLNSGFRTDFGSVRLNTHNSPEHELAKTLKSYKLLKDGHKILTEVTFKSGGRADILDLCCFRVFEILHSETKSEALRKEGYYPNNLDIYYIRSEDILKGDD